jgi:hypothetical protein
MNGPGRIGRPVNEEKWFPGTAVLFYDLVRIVDEPGFLHSTLDRLCIEAGVDFLHKTPLVDYQDAEMCVKECWCRRTK